MDCASTTFDQVFSVAILAANIATFGTAKEATVPLKVGEEAVKVGDKVIVVSSKVGKYAAKAVAAFQAVEEGTHTGNMVVRTIRKQLHNTGAVISTTKSVIDKAYTAYQLYKEEFVNSEFVNQTSEDIDTELTNKLYPEYARMVKEAYALTALGEFAESNEMKAWEYAGYAMTAASLADPTGVVDVVAAYAHPICKTVTPFPTLPAKYLK